MTKTLAVILLAAFASSCLHAQQVLNYPQIKGAPGGGIGRIDFFEQTNTYRVHVQASTGLAQNLSWKWPTLTDTAGDCLKSSGLGQWNPGSCGGVSLPLSLSASGSGTGSFSLFVLTQTGSGQTFQATQNNAQPVGVFTNNGAGLGVQGITATGTGVYGGATGAGIGVYGYSADASKYGVKGENLSGSGGYGVYGISSGTGSRGVYGSITSGSWAVEGVATTGGGGISGTGAGSGTGASGFSPSGIGVYGNSTTGYAAWFDAKVQVNSNLTITGTCTGCTPQALGTGNVPNFAGISLGFASVSGGGSFGGSLSVGTTISAAGGNFQTDSAGNLSAVGFIGSSSFVRAAGGFRVGGATGVTSTTCSQFTLGICTAP